MEYREKIGNAIAVALIVAVVAFAVIMFVVTGSENEPTPAPEAVATPILSPATMTDLLRTPTPTASPTPSPEPTIRPPSGAGPERITVAAPPPVDVDYADWYIVQLAFVPAEQYRALRTAWCESTFDDAAVGEAGEIGRFQIHPLWMDDPGVQEIVESWFPGATGSVETFTAALHHEHVNAQVAAYIQGKDGWRPWTTRFGCSGWQG